MGNQLEALTVIFTEFYYWVTIVLMFLIHVGFCLYEVGVSRRKNMLHTLMKNAMIVPLVTITFFFFGWWIYFAFQYGPGITGGLREAPWALPWNELMGPHMGGQPRDDGLTAADTATWARLNGVFWAAFLLFSWTTASVLSGAVIERIRSGAFWVLAVLVGSITWVIAAAWGWSDSGWMVHTIGYHDAYAGGVVHAVAGASALGILVHLGPRIGRFAPDGSARTFPPHNPWLVAIGLFLIFTGFWGFYAACNVPMIDIDPEDGRLFFSATTIYLTPTTLSAITVNLLMALAAGMLMAYFLSKGDPFWTFSGGLGGVIGASAGNDLYHPMQATLIAAVIVFCAFKLHYWVERRFKIDDAVGAIAVHGYCGALGVVAAGFVLWGYPSSPAADSVAITPWGQLLGAVIVFWILGFAPAYVVAGVLKRAGVLRIPVEVEIGGLDRHTRREERQQTQAIRTAEREYLIGTGWKDGGES
jgi:Amt family ammonium transporter